MITDKDWNFYLKKYEEKYRIYRDKTGMWKIICKKGEIYLYSIEKLLLAIYFFGVSKQFLRKVKAETRLTIQAEGDKELIASFSEKNLSELSHFLGIKRKKVLTEEQRQALRERLQNMAKKPIFAGLQHG